MTHFHISLRSSLQMGEAIRRRRKLLGWSQVELARRAGIKQANLSAIEHGVEGVRFSTLNRLLAALNLELLVQERLRPEIQKLPS